MAVSFRLGALHVIDHKLISSSSDHRCTPGLTPQLAQERRSVVHPDVDGPQIGDSDDEALLLFKKISMRESRKQKDASGISTLLYLGCDAMRRSEI
jgi:hypothetical protein